MNQGRRPSAARSKIFSFFIVLAAIPGCKDRGDGPKAPEENVELAESQAATGTGDAQAGNPDLPESGPGDPNPPTLGNTLPQKFVTNIADCQKQTRYYDLQLASCTELALADFPCDLTVLLSEQSAVLSPTQKMLLKEYVDKNLQGFSLYACTIEESNPALHFYKVEADKIRAHNVKIAGAT